MPISPLPEPPRRPVAITSRAVPAENAFPPLPRPLTPLVGRRSEIAAVTALVGEGARLLTLTGPGGVGKTRVALAVATDLKRAFDDGAVFVSLTELAEAGLVPGAVARAFRVRGGDEATFEALLINAVGDRRILLVLDNVEHVLDAAPFVARLVAACPSLVVLATSRAPMRVAGEQEFAIPPLPVDGLDQASDSDRSDAVALFVQRARTVDPTFVLSENDPRDVATICRRLDGLPLAIELAAAWSKLLRPKALLERLNARFDLLTSGPRDLPDRLRTMRAAIAWSYDLLAPPERAALRHLAAFVGGWTLEAAEAVAVVGNPDRPPTPSVFDLLTALVDQSLVQRMGGGDDPRFGMLETIRAFAWDEAEAAGESETTRRRHAIYFAGLAEAASPRMPGVERPATRDWLRGEVANLRAALAWAIERHETDMAARLAVALFVHWFTVGDRRDGRRWLATTLAMPDGDPVLRADALFAASALASAAGDQAEAAALAAESLSVAVTADHRLGVVRALDAQATVAERDDRLDDAVRHYQEELRLARETGEPFWIALALTSLADVTLRLGDRDRAAHLAAEAMGRWRTIEHPWGTALALGTLGAVAMAGDDPARSAGFYAASLDAWITVGDPGGIGGSLVGLARIAAAVGELERAARLLGAARALGDTVGVGHLTRNEGETRTQAMVEARLGGPALAAAVAEGRALGTAAAIAEGHAIVRMTAERANDRVAAPPTPLLPGGLSEREAEVLRLTARGLTTAAIAERLYLSPNTVHAHLRRIYRKLGVGSRAEATRFALDHGLA